MEAGKERVETQVEGSDFVFRVSDNGMGIAPELRDTLFQPFTTSKKEGTGLGLYVTAERVRELGGTISSETAWPRGTSFEVRLPCFAPTAKISE